MNKEELDYLKLKLNQFKRFNLKASKFSLPANLTYLSRISPSKSNLACSLYSTLSSTSSSFSTKSMPISCSRYQSTRRCSKFLKHLKYYQEIWSFENNPAYSENNDSTSQNNEFLANSDLNKIILNKFPNSKSENEISSPESNDSGIQSDEINQRLTNDFCSLYSTVNKPKQEKNVEPEDGMKDKDKEDEIIVHVEQQQLPLGWIRCCDDEENIYYWHKPTGTVQRSPPPLSQSQQSLKLEKDLSNYNLSSILTGNRSSTSPVTTNSDDRTNSSRNESPSHQDNVFMNMSYHEDQSSSMSTASIICSNEIKEDVDESCSNSSHSSSNNDIVKYHRRFYVRSLGWVRISEQDLTQEKSSKAVNKCIHDLSHGFKDYNDVVARWGEGKDLFMDIEDNYLILVDPIENKLLNKQAITSIRVWGVGRDNGRDFAYVARDKLSKIHMCHVFRCEDVPAKEIANTLRDLCKQIMLKKGLVQKTPKQLRPDLLSEIKRQENQLESNSNAENASIMPLIKFPSPADEPRKTINCKYLGSPEVNRPNGMNVLNDAINKLYISSYQSYLNNNSNNKDFITNDNPYEAICDNLEDVLSDKDKTIDLVKIMWQNVAVTISPSTMYTHKINDDGTSELLFECRIRYLSFFGIASNVKLCGFFEHDADNTFKCHTFYNEPSSGPLCKTVEAACKLRYQKCLDAHPEAAKSLNSNTQSNNSTNKGLGTQIKSMFDLIRSRKKR